MAFQNGRNSNFENFETPNFGVSGQNDIWMQPPWLIIENTIRGKVMAFPPPNPSCGESFESMYGHDSFVHHKCSNYTLTNFLFGLCKSVWIIDPLVIRPSPHLEALVRPSTPEVLRIKEHTPTPSSIVFTFKLSFESLKECGGVPCRHHIHHHLRNVQKGKHIMWRYSLCKQ